MANPTTLSASSSPSSPSAVRVLQIGPLPLPALNDELAQLYAVSVLSEQADPAQFLAEQGAEFQYVMTSANMGLSANVVNALPNLQFVSSFGVGFDKLDKDSLLARGVRVGYTPGVLDDCVADMAFALLLDAARQVSAGDRFVRAGKWARNERRSPATKVSGKRIGILGLGRIGSQIALRAQGFQMSVGYHNRHAIAGSSHTYFESLEQLAQWCDFLVIAAAGGDATRHLVDAKVLQALGPGGFLVNIARGTVVDEQALLLALQNGGIAGAGLDVFENEPHPLPGLLALDNVVLSPHTASGTNETRRAMADLALENLRSCIDSGKPVQEVPLSADAAAAANAAPKATGG